MQLTDTLKRLLGLSDDEGIDEATRLIDGDPEYLQKKLAAKLMRARAILEALEGDGE